MNKQQLTAALESIGMRPGRGLGQNFLLDGNLLDYIVRLSAPGKGERILEVGPGFGALTSRLLKAGAEVYAVEFDHRIAEYLRTHIEKGNFHLTEADACRVDYVELLENRRSRICRIRSVRSSSPGCSICRIRRSRCSSCFSARWASG